MIQYEKKNEQIMKLFVVFAICFYKNKKEETFIHIILFLISTYEQKKRTQTKNFFNNNMSKMTKLSQCSKFRANIFAKVAAKIKKQQQKNNNNNNNIMMMNIHIKIFQQKEII